MLLNIKNNCDEPFKTMRHSGYAGGELYTYFRKLLLLLLIARVISGFAQTISPV